jgi:protein-tyrosine-phosphatase
MKLLYVCEANLFRSPIAATLTRKKTKGTNLQVNSAGIWIDDSLEPSGFVFTALRKLGYSNHRPIPKEIDIELLKKQDLILCMEKSQVEEILKLAPEVKNKVYTLPEYAGFPNEEIPDPAKLVYSEDPREAEPDFRITTRKEEEKAIKFWITFIKRIEKYVDLAIARMKRDGLIS